jgi:hypothetical protein
MRLLFVFLFIIGIHFNNVGQTFIHFPTDTTIEWKHYRYGCDNQAQCCTNLFLLNYYSGDSLLNGKIWKKYDSKVILNDNPGCGYNALNVLINEDTITKQVKIIPDFAFYFDTLLFDYNWGVGDTVNGYLYSTYGSNNVGPIIDSIKIINIDGKNRKIWYYGGQLPNTDFFIEGLGGNSGFFQNNFGYDLLCIRDSVNCIFMNEYTNFLSPQVAKSDTMCTDTTFHYNSIDEFSANSSINVYPNPFSHTVNLEIKREALYIEVYDLFGKKMLNKKVSSGSLDLSFLNPGVYFLKAGNNTFKLIKL